MDSANINAGWAPKSFCVADEHYIPTLLASLGKDNETDCMVSCSCMQESQRQAACMDMLTLHNEIFCIDPRMSTCIIHTQRALL